MGGQRCVLCGVCCLYFGFSIPTFLYFALPTFSKCNSRSSAFFFQLHLMIPKVIPGVGKRTTLLSYGTTGRQPDKRAGRHKDRRTERDRWDTYRYLLYSPRHSWYKNVDSRRASRACSCDTLRHASTPHTAHPCHGNGSHILQSETLSSISSKVVYTLSRFEKISDNSLISFA